MYAWAIVLKSNYRQFVACVFAETQADAYGKAYQQLGEKLDELNDENPDKTKWNDEHTKDFSVHLHTFAEIPDFKEGYQPKESQAQSGFDSQISKLKTK